MGRLVFMTSPHARHRTQSSAARTPGQWGSAAGEQYPEHLESSSVYHRGGRIYQDSSESFEGPNNRTSPDEPGGQYRYADQPDSSEDVSTPTASGDREHGHAQGYSQYSVEDEEAAAYGDDGYGFAQDDESADPGYAELDEPDIDAGDASSSDKKTNILLGILVALALIASVVMLWTNNSIALRLALLAALWAAVIGFFLVARYRRAADAARRELDYTRQLRDAEREYLETQHARSEAPDSAGLPDEEMELLAQIRDQLDELRGQLEELRGRSLEYEPAALRAQAWRLQELEGKTDNAWASHEKTGDVPGAPSLDAVAGRFGPEESTPHAGGISPELAELLRDEEAGQQKPEEPQTVQSRGRGSYEGPASPTETTSPTESPLTASADESHRAGSHRVQQPGSQPEPAPRPETPSGGRRRADSRTGALTVAELLARGKH